MGNKINHWTSLLPEAGDITILGEAQYKRHLELARLREQVAIKEAEIFDEEKMINRLVRENWTRDEIAQTKERYREQSNFVPTIMWESFSRFFAGTLPDGKKFGSFLRKKEEGKES